MLVQFRNEPPPKGGSDHYLEFVIADNVSASDRNAIVQALAAISGFFGLRVEGDGGGFGGLSIGLDSLQSAKLRPPPTGPTDRPGVGLAR